MNYHDRRIALCKRKMKRQGIDLRSSPLSRITRVRGRAEHAPTEVTGRRTKHRKLCPVAVDDDQRGGVRGRRCPLVTRDWMMSPETCRKLGEIVGKRITLASGCLEVRGDGPCD